MPNKRMAADMGNTTRAADFGFDVVSKYFETEEYRNVFKVKNIKYDPLITIDQSKIEDYPFIAINQKSYNMLHVDVDDNGTISAPLLPPAFDLATYDEFGIPLPNFAVVTSGNRFHAFWLLANPLSYTATHRSMALFHDIRLKIIGALNGDPACNTSGAVRNPFYMKANVRVMSTKLYSLSDLNIHFRISSKIYDPYFREYGVGSRNNATFKAGLAHYIRSNRSLSIEALFLWMKGFQSLISDVPHLCDAEVHYIARSIVRNGYRYKARDPRNYGAMKLQPVNYSGLNTEERQAIIRERQSTGAGYTHKKRQEGTATRIICAIEELRREGIKVTQKNITEKSGISLRTVKSYWNRPEIAAARTTSA